MLRPILRIAEAYPTEDHPLAFSERIIDQCIDHTMGADMARTDMDLKSIRAVFRTSGGSWEKLMGGDDRQHKILGDVIMAWGKLPKHNKGSNG